MFLLQHCTLQLTIYREQDFIIQNKINLKLQQNNMCSAFFSYLIILGNFYEINNILVVPLEQYNKKCLFAGRKCTLLERH